MKTVRLFVWMTLLLAALPTHAQFTLNLSPVSPGSAQLQFTREPGYYYSLESTRDLTTTYTPASGWMMGDGLPATWPLHYPINPAASGGSTSITSSDTFSLYPFENGKTLVTWKDLSDTRYSALITEDDSTLPPTVVVPSNATAPGMFLLIGRVAWNPSYEALSPSLLPVAQQTVLSHLTTRHADVLAASTGTPGGGFAVETDKQFYRIQRVEADADGDGLDWFMETFVLGSNPDEVDSDGDGYEDSVEIGRGTDPTDFFDGSPPVMTIVGGDGQLAWVGQFDDSPVVIQVKNTLGRSVPNHKVVFSAPFPAFAASKVTGTSVSATFEAMTNESGYALAFFRQPMTKRTTTVLHVQVQGKAPNSTASVSFSTYAVGGNVNIPAAPNNLGGHWVPGVTTEVEAYEVTWEDASNNEVDFVIEKSIGDENHWIPVAVVPTNSTSWRDYDLDLGHEVYYQVTSVGP